MKGPLAVAAAALALGGGGAAAAIDNPVPVPEGNAGPDFGVRSSWKGKFHGLNQRQRRKRERQTGRR